MSRIFALAVRRELPTSVGGRFVGVSEDFDEITCIGTPLITLESAEAICFLPCEAKSAIIKSFFAYGQTIIVSVCTVAMKLFHAQIALTDFNIITSVMKDEKLATAVVCDFDGVAVFFRPHNEEDLPVEADLRDSASEFSMQAINAAPELQLKCFTASTSTFNLLGLLWFLATGSELPWDLMYHLDGPLNIEWIKKVANVDDEVARLFQSFLIIDPAKRASVSMTPKFCDPKAAFQNLMLSLSALQLELESRRLDHIDALKKNKSDISPQASLLFGSDLISPPWTSSPLFDFECVSSLFFFLSYSRS